jgi:hypothetical protein
MGGGGGGYMGGKSHVFSPNKKPGYGGKGYISPLAYEGLMLPGVNGTTANNTHPYYSLLTKISNIGGFIRNTVNISGVVIVVHYDTNFILA